MFLEISISEPISLQEKINSPQDAARKLVYPGVPKTLSINVPDHLTTRDNLGTYKPWFNGMKHFYTVKPLPPKPKE